MKKRINALLLAVTVLSASGWGFHFFQQRYAASNQIIRPVEDRMYKHVEAEQELSDEEIIELKDLEPERKRRDFNLWMMVLFGILIAFAGFYLFFELYVHGRKAKPKPQAPGHHAPQYRKPHHSEDPPS